MIVVSSMAIRELMSRIVGATHGLQNEVGEPVVTPTIGEQQLRMAAITALQIATGEPVWPGDREIVFRKPEDRFGIFRVER